MELPAVTVPSTSTTNGTAFRWLNWVGHIIVRNVEIEIGGQRIDKHYGDWLHIWNELTQSAGHQLGYANMVGNTPKLTSPTKNVTGSSVSVSGDVLYIPLEFWFARNPGLALPLIALNNCIEQKSTQLKTFEHCFKKNMFESRDFLENQTQVLVTCR